MSRINYPAVKKYKRRDRSIHPSIHRAFETAAPMYVTYVGPGDKSRGSFAPRKGLLRCVGIAQFVSGSRGERGIEGRRRGEESVPRDVNFSTGEKRKICGNTERSTPLSFFPVISPATLHARLCKIVRWIRKRGRSWINRSSRCAYFPPRKNDAADVRWTSVQSYVRRKLDDQIREADIRWSISDATLSRERERLDQGCNAVWT